MQIVIDISEELYNRFGYEYGEENLISKYTNDAILEAFCNGTPLPKGHGILIDADDIALIDEQFYVPSDYYVAESAINDAPTIIEADRSKSEKMTNKEKFIEVFGEELQRQYATKSWWDQEYVPPESEEE